MSEIRNRIEKNHKRLEAWSKKHQIEAYRIYERDIPDFPFIVDRYGEYFVIYDRSDERIDSQKQDRLPQLVDALRELFQPAEKQLIIKRRERQKGESQYEKIGTSGKTMVIRESQAKFIVNLYDYLDTGLFLDHRLMRQKVFELAKGKDFLNLFSYTGSVSVFAALGGARTVSVDMSATYSRWAMDNFAVNEIDPGRHEFITENALEFLADKRYPRKFDLIFLDPPTFSNSKKMDSSFEVERDQGFLVENSMRLLKPGGTLFFSNNKRSFKLELSLALKFPAKDITPQTLPKDFRDPKVHHVFELQAH